MAASSKNTKECRLAVSFKKRLDRLGCPFSVDVDQAWITELLCKPGEPRIRILHWLFSRFDSDLCDLLELEQATLETRIDSRLQRLLHVASVLGLCQYDDVDLIRGVTGGSKQAQFLDQLIDIICIADSAEDPHTKAMVTPGTVSDASSLAEQVAEDQAYLEHLVSQHRMDTLFNTSITLLPPDIARQLDTGQDKQSFPVPDFQQLSGSYSDLMGNLQRQAEILAELKDEYDYEGRSDTTTVSRTLGLALSELAQFITGFMYSFENEIEPWCNKSRPELTQLGTAVKRVHMLLTQLKTFQVSLRSIRVSHDALNIGSRKKIEPLLGHRSDDLVGSTMTAAEHFQQYIGVLEESVRREASVLSSQSNSFKT